MDDTHFWTIIQASIDQAGGDQDMQLASIQRQLSALPDSGLIDFERILNQQLNNAAQWDLWGAAYRINGGCSDDGFVYFRLWLVSRGRDIYSRAVASPDSLAEVVDRDENEQEFEPLRYAAREIYEKRTGTKMPRSKAEGSIMPKGAPWNFEDRTEVGRRLPRLARLRD